MTINLTLSILAAAFGGFLLGWHLRADWCRWVQRRETQRRETQRREAPRVARTDVRAGRLRDDAGPAPAPQRVAYRAPALTQRVHEDIA